MKFGSCSVIAAGGMLLALTFTMSYAAYAGDFVIRLNGAPICTFTEDGDLVFEDGGELRYGHLPTMVRAANAQEFIIRRSSDGQVLARVNGADGQMYINGHIFQDQTSIAQHAAEPEFIIRSGGTIVALIDDEGNLYLRGEVTPAVCIHHGIPDGPSNNAGYLENDASLPDTGTGYYHYLGIDEADTDDWCGACWMHEKIRLAGVLWNRTPRIGVGDISKTNGGYWPPHSSHQNGLDIDVRYVRSDDQEINYTFPNSGYDQEATQALVSFFIYLGATTVYVDSRSGIVGTGVQNLAGHEDHFHVRFFDPDGTSN